jgi:DNA-binding XRE family transcriptional regulator
MGVLKDIEKQMTPEEIEKNEEEYLQETASLREAQEVLAKSLAEYVQSILTKENISQNELRRRLGISSATMTAIVNGKGNPTIHTVAKIASLVGEVPSFTWKRAAP